MYRVTDPLQTPAPDMERTAYNQMPKNIGWTDLKLYRFEGTNLYQWRGRKQMDMPGDRVYYPWYDQATEVFEIK